MHKSGFVSPTNEMGLDNVKRMLLTKIDLGRLSVVLTPAFELRMRETYHLKRLKDLSGVVYSSRFLIA